MKAMLKSVFLLFAGIVIGCIPLISCSEFGEEEPIVDPPIVRPPMKQIRLTVAIDSLERDSDFRGITHWNEKLHLVVSSLDRYGTRIYHAVASDGPSISAEYFTPTSAFGTSSATFEGEIVAYADSLVLYCHYNNLWKSFVEQPWSDKEYPFDVLVATGRTGADDLSFTLTSRTSHLNLTLTNKTGEACGIRKIIMEVADPQQPAPFHRFLDSYLDFYGIPETSLSTVLNFSKPMNIASDSSAVVTINMLLTNEAALLDKAVRYTIETDKDIKYVYTKTGKEYKRGRTNQEAIVLEGK